MVTAEDIIRKDVQTQDINSSISQAIHLFQNTDAIIVTDQGKYHGMILKRILIDPTVNPQTKLHTVLTHAPKLQLKSPLEEIARVMVENKIYTLPVLHNDTLLGVVLADDVIQKLTEQQLGTQPAKTIMSTNPLSVSPYETIGKILHLFRQEHLTYLPVLDHTTVVGAISLNMLINNVLFTPGNIDSHEHFASEKKQKLDLPAKTIMLEQPLLLTPETTIQNVHRNMHTSETSGILIGKDNHLHGIITHKELLAPFAGFEREETIDIQFHHRNDNVQGFNKEATVQFLREEFLKNYQKFLETGSLHVSLEQHKELKQGLHRVVCEMRLSGKPGVFYATQEGYGPMQAMKNAYLAIEHQIKKAKNA